MAGRKPKPYTCPLCLDNPTRYGNSCYFDCECGARLVLKDSELRETRSYSTKPEAQELGQVRKKLTADEYEELCG
jgi:hypothetical protein